MESNESRLQEADSEKGQHQLDGAEELRLLYQMNGEALEKIKDRQWSTARYGVLLLITVAGVGRWAGPESNPQTLLITVALLIAAVGTLFLIKTQASLVEFRRLALCIRSGFPRNATRALERATPTAKYTRFRYNSFFMWSFVSLLWVGSLVVIFGTPLVGGEGAASITSAALPSQGTSLFDRLRNRYYARTAAEQEKAALASMVDLRFYGDSVWINSLRTSEDTRGLLRVTATVHNDSHSTIHIHEFRGYYLSEEGTVVGETSCNTQAWADCDFSALLLRPGYVADMSVFISKGPSLARQDTVAALIQFEVYE